MAADVDQGADLTSANSFFVMDGEMDLNLDDDIDLADRLEGLQMSEYFLCFFYIFCFNFVIYLSSFLSFLLIFCHSREMADDPFEIDTFDTFEEESEES